MLYMLILTDPELSGDGYLEDFGIGVFRTKERAEEVARYYLENVRGFCDYPCTYRIAEMAVAGPGAGTPDTVWIVQGWNLNDDLDEVEIVESPCFLTKAAANRELQAMKKSHPRSQWAVSRWQIGELNWQEGFVRA